MDARIETQKLLAELERSFPERLIERSGIPLGDPGKLAFSIHRGPFFLQLDGDELEIGVDLRGQAEVCKPVALLGCVRYASCAPEGQARASLHLQLDNDYRLHSPRVRIPVTRPCTLSSLGLDMTQEVQQQADKQADEIRQRIERALPGLDDTIISLWRALSTTVALGNKSCAKITPRAVLQAEPRLQNGWLSGAIGVEGQIQIQTPCPDFSEPSALPKPQKVKSDPGIDLEIPLVISWDEVGFTLTRSLAQTELRWRDEILRVTEVSAGPGEDGTVRLKVTVVGRLCGSIWLDATPEARLDGIVLHSLELTPSEQERLGVSTLQWHRGGIERRLRLPLPVEVNGMHRRMEVLVMRLLGQEGLQGELRSRLGVKLQPIQTAQALVAREGLVALISVTGEAHVELSPRE